MNEQAGVRRNGARDFSRVWRTRPLSAFQPHRPSFLSQLPRRNRLHISSIHCLRRRRRHRTDGRPADALRICHANNEALNHVASRLDRLRGTDGRTDRQSVTPRRPGGQWRHAVTRRAALFQRAFSREASRASEETDGRTDRRTTDGESSTLAKSIQSLSGKQQDLRRRLTTSCRSKCTLTHSQKQRARLLLSVIREGCFWDASYPTPKWRSLRLYGRRHSLQHEWACMAAAPCSAVGVGVGNERLERGSGRGERISGTTFTPIVAKEGCGGKGRRGGGRVGGCAASPALARRSRE